MENFCLCVDDEGSTKELTHNDGLWCCNTEPCTHESFYSNATCKGKAIPLTEKCPTDENDKNVCNSYPSNPRRNYYFQRSHLDICDDR